MIVIVYSPLKIKALSQEANYFFFELLHQNVGLEINKYVM